MRKILTITLFSAIALSAVMLSSCKKEETAGEVRLLSLYITPIQTIVEIGDSAEINVFASYSNGSSSDITAEPGVSVTPSNDAVVYRNGKIFGQKMGEAELTVTYNGFTDKAPAICAELDRLILTANYEDNTILMIPVLDTINKHKDLSLTAVLKAGDKEYTKEINSKDYTIKTADGDKHLLQLNDSLIVASDTVNSKLLATYKNKNVIANVLVAEYDGTEFRLDVGLAGDSVDVMTLGSEFAVKAEAEYVWTNVKRKKKGEETKDTSATVDIISKLFVNSDDPTVVGVKSSTASALQIGDAEIYSYFKVWDNDVTTKIDTLTRAVRVLDEQGAVKLTKYVVELEDDYAYTGDVVNFKFFAEYVRIIGKDTTAFRVDLTNTANDNIVWAISTPDTASVEFGYAETCNGKALIDEFGWFDEGDYYADTTFKVKGPRIAVLYKHNDGTADTTFSGAFDFYTCNLAFDYEGDSLFLSTAKLSDEKLVCFRKDYKILDDSGRDITKLFNIYEHKAGVENGFVYGLSNKDYYYYGKTLTVIYGPEKRKYSQYIEKQTE